MVTAKQIAIRMTHEDVALLEAIQRQTGHVTFADTIRFVLRQYAKANSIEVMESDKPKP